MNWGRCSEGIFHVSEREKKKNNETLREDIISVIHT